MLQGELHSERMRNKTLRYTLANLQDDSLSALNKALIPAMSTRSLPARMHTSSQVIQIHVNALAWCPYRQYLQESSSQAI